MRVNAVIFYILQMMKLEHRVTCPRSHQATDSFKPWQSSSKALFLVIVLPSLPLYIVAPFKITCKVYFLLVSQKDP